MSDSGALDHFLGYGLRAINIYILLLQPSLLISVLLYRENGAYDCGNSNQ